MSFGRRLKESHGRHSPINAALTKHKRVNPRRVRMVRTNGRCCSAVSSATPAAPISLSISLPFCSDIVGELASATRRPLLPSHQHQARQLKNYFDTREANSQTEFQTREHLFVWCNSSTTIHYKKESYGAKRA
jgi:hypothetical protein